MNGHCWFRFKRKKLQRQAEAISGSHQLRAHVMKKLQTVGVKGDQRAYEPIVVLSGKFPGHDPLEEVSIQITNTLPVSRVLIELR